MRNRPESKTENLKCFLSDAEKQEISELLVRTMRDMRDAERAFASIRKDHTSRMETMEGRVSIMVDKLAVGYEYRDVECRIVYNSPAPRTKTIVRADSPGEIVREEPMTDDECQENLPLENFVSVAPQIPDGFKLEPPVMPSDEPAMPPPETPPSGKDAAAND